MGSSPARGPPSHQTAGRARPTPAHCRSSTPDEGGSAVEQVRLGATGLHVSRICLGMLAFGNDAKRAWVLDEERAEPIVRAAVEAGITFFDTADSYSGGASEIATGRLLKKLLSRDELVLATKVY